MIRKALPFLFTLGLLIGNLALFAGRAWADGPSPRGVTGWGDVCECCGDICDLDEEN